MRCLVVVAHPVETSLCGAFARTAVETLAAQGHAVTLHDLYRPGFPPALTEAERLSYYTGRYHRTAVAAEIDALVAAEGLVLVFPTWWFGFPAVLKGWFDRVWAPGVAFVHSADYGPIRPRLDGLRHLLAVTTLGSPWWVDLLVMRRPVRRVLKTAIVGGCAPACRFEMMSLYGAERPDAARAEAFSARLAARLHVWS